MEAYKLFPHLAFQYPNALFILNTRDREDWVRSRLEHGKNLYYVQRSMLHYNVASIHDLADRWRIEWEHHHRQVAEFFACNSYRFLVCRIETDLPHILNDALPECKLDPKYYRIRGKKSSSQHGPELQAAMHAARKFLKLIRIVLQTFYSHVKAAISTGIKVT